MNGDVRRKSKKRNHVDEKLVNKIPGKKLEKEDKLRKRTKITSKSLSLGNNDEFPVNLPRATAKLRITPTKSEYISKMGSLQYDLIPSSSSETESKTVLELNNYDTNDRDIKLHENVLDEFVHGNFSNMNAEVITCNKPFPNFKVRKVHTKKKKSTSPEVKKVKFSMRIESSSVPTIEDDVIAEPTISALNTSDVSSDPEELEEEPEENLETSKSLTQLVLSHLPKSTNLIVVKEGETMHFHGVYEFNVLHGQIELLGYKMDKNSPKAKVYSLRGSSLLYLRNITSFADNKKISLRELPLKVHGDIEIEENCCVITYKQLEEPKMNFISKHVSQQLHCQVDEMLKPTEGTWNYIQIDQTWEETVDVISPSTKMVITGGKGVGKSTFLRYAINRLLSRFSKIKIVDLDPGQSEFTVAGCISITTLEEPLFGVNYTHLRRPDKSILSSINVAYEPQKFIRDVKRLLSHLQEEDGVPILFNYVGFSHGLGINILASVLYCIEPTDVLQILSDNPKKNFKRLLNPETVKANSILFGCNNHSDEDLDYNLHIVESMCNESIGWKAESRQIREMSILSYFGEKVTMDGLSLYCPNLDPYEIELNALQLVDENGNVIPPAAVNANLVALCYVDDCNLKTFACLGWGIVRGIDISNNVLVLITPEDLDTLDKVTHLVLNCGVMLPPSLYMTNDKMIGVTPYLISGDLTLFGELTKRSHVSAKK